MGYTDKEQSLIFGEPVELYRFKRGNTYWTYNSSDMSIIYDGRTYEPVLIKRSSIGMNLNSLKNFVKIEVDKTNTFAANYIFVPVDGIVEVTIYRGHDGDYVTYWKGFVHTVGFNSRTAIIVVGSKSTSLKRSGLMRKFSRNCGYPLYTTRCTVLKGDYKISGTISSISGLEIVATIFGTKSDNWLTGGKFIVENYSRMIVYHNQSNEKIVIAHRIPDLTVGASFDAFAGCDHAATTCKNKFSNGINFGGQEFIPNKNPFSGDSIEN